MKAKFTATAFEELNEIHNYIAKDNATAAKAVVLRMEQVVAASWSSRTSRAQ